MRQGLRLTVAALGLSALLTWHAGPALFEAALAESNEVTIEMEEDIVLEPVEIGELDLLDLDDFDMDIETPTPEPTKTPEPTPTPKPEEAPPWLTSVNYPKDKVNFEKEIWAILTGKWGLADFQAAGLMSSIQAESSFSPYNVQGMGGSDDRGKYLYDTKDGVGFGLCQWTSSGRKAALKRFAASRGSEDLVWDFDTQMAFMHQELNMNILKATGTLYEAAEWTVMRYERPNQRYANSWPGTRYEKGRKIYKNHTGKDYEEPPLEFSVKFGDVDALDADALALDANDPGSLTVESNYYWRLTQTDATVDGWLEARCASFYRPSQTELCVCGYPCEGEKTLTLAVAIPPEPGETLTATLRFEIYRGAREVKTVTVSVTGAAEANGTGKGEGIVNREKGTGNAASKSSVFKR